MINTMNHFELIFLKRITYFYFSGDGKMIFTSEVVHDFEYQWIINVFLDKIYCLGLTENLDNLFSFLLHIYLSQVLIVFLL